MSDDPKAAIHYAGDDFFIASSPGGHAQVLETNSKRGSAATPVELLLMALGACSGADVVSILKKKRERVTDYRIEVRGERRSEHPRGYTKFRVHHIIRGHSVSAKAVADAIELSDNKYCSVAATLRPAAEIMSTYEIVEEV